MMSPEDRETFDSFKVWVEAVGETVTNLIRTMRESDPARADNLSVRFNALIDLSLSEHRQATAQMDRIPPDGHAAQRHLEVAWAAMMEIKELAEDNMMVAT